MALALVGAVLALLAAAQTPAPESPQAAPPEPPGMDVLRAKREAEESARKAAPPREVSPSRPCPFLSGDARPIIDVKGTNQRVPQAFYPIGFSKHGRFAWLETSKGMEEDQHSWFLHIVSLGSDRSLVKSEFSVPNPGVAAMCDAKSATLTRVLKRHGIVFGSAPRWPQLKTPRYRPPSRSSREHPSRGSPKRRIACCCAARRARSRWACSGAWKSPRATTRARSPS